MLQFFIEPDLADVGRWDGDPEHADQRQVLAAGVLRVPEVEDLLAAALRRLAAEVN